MRTLGELGVRQSLQAVTATPTERTIARRLLALLEDRRFLFALFEYEIPRHVMESLQLVRAELRDADAAVPERSPLQARIRALMSACSQFLTDAGDLNHNEPLFGGNDGARANVFITQLASLRKVFGVHIRALSTDYALEVSAELQRIMPTGDADGA